MFTKKLEVVAATFLGVAADWTDSETMPASPAVSSKLNRKGDGAQTGLEETVHVVNVNVVGLTGISVDTSQPPPLGWDGARPPHPKQMKAVDHSIKIGAVLVADEDSNANYKDETVTNPRTSVTHNGFSSGA